MSEATQDYDESDWTEEGEQKEPTVTDEIVEEETTERPDGLPSLMPFAVLYSNRRKRADFFASAMSPAVQELMEAGGEADEVGNVSIAMQAMADMEDALRKVVHPASKGALDKWLRESDDHKLMQAYSWYMAQMGEVTASST